ncbi:helix-turn-helix domain-containing protein [Aquipuribacter hungaricus]|uniref:Helix-turn-helix domain-containing protein n=1 Tax=Aquipuribacter hungaricus TaxID=545624 RepID=A0ABV7WG29_9MICO
MDRTADLAAAIGGRVRRERQARRWTLDQMASATGVSRRMLVSVEQGAANPSVGTLLRVAEALGVGLPALVEPPATGPVQVTRHGGGATLWTSEAGGRAVLVASTRAPGVVELWDWTLAAGDRYASRGHVPGTTELVHVLSGALTVEVDGAAHELAAGDAVAFPGDVDHAYAATGTGTGTPGAAGARFSLAVHEPVTGARSTAGARSAAGRG